MYDVVALGEILIDFTPAGLSEQGNILFERNPGGAPANVLACVSKLGGRTAFIGKAGDDMFGRYLKDVLDAYNVDSRGLMFTGREKTTLAFVQLDEQGDRQFSFYRNPGADTTLDEDEIEYNLIKNTRVFHFGSLTLTNEPSRSSTVKALDFAQKNGCIISYDPNLRPALWNNIGHALNEIKSVLKYADIVKVSEEELEFITGEKDLAAGSSMLAKQYNICLVLVTMGKRGCFYRKGEITGSKPAFENVRTIDTTGAGDSFLGAFLYYVLSKGINKISEIGADLLNNAVIFSNAAASICTAKKGAIPAMPDMEQVKSLLAQNGIII